MGIQTPDMFPGCQKATEWDGWLPTDDAGVYVDPKCDGYRLSAVVTRDDRVHFFCGKPKSPDWAENLEHIADALLALNPRDCMYDGELMATTWNETSSLVRRKRSLMSDDIKARVRNELRFHLFDMVPSIAPEQLCFLSADGKRKPIKAVNVPMRERLNHLLAALQTGPGTEVLQRVQAQLVYDNDTLQTVYAEYRRDGYEGAMVKLPGAPYYFDRVGTWRKMKPWKTIEVTVLSAVEGLGKHAGRLGALECCTDDGDVISIGGGFSDTIREKYWTIWRLNPATLTGLRIEVTLQDSDVATARHANFLRERPRDT